MSHAAVRIHRRGSFGSTFASASIIVEIDRLTGRPKSTRRTGPANEIAGRRLPVVPVKLISPQSNNKKTNFQYTEQSLTKAEAQGGKNTKCRVTYYLHTIRGRDG